MSWALTPELYFAAKERLVVGERPVLRDLMEIAAEITVVEEEALVRQVTGRKAR
jgi:hypothetical protein